MREKISALFLGLEIEDSLVRRLEASLKDSRKDVTTHSYIFIQFRSNGVRPFVEFGEIFNIECSADV